MPRDKGHNARFDYTARMGRRHPALPANRSRTTAGLRVSRKQTPACSARGPSPRCARPTRLPPLAPAPGPSRKFARVPNANSLWATAQCGRDREGSLPNSPAGINNKELQRKRLNSSYLVFDKTDVSFCRSADIHIMEVGVVSHVKFYVTNPASWCLIIE